MVDENVGPKKEDDKHILDHSLIREPLEKILDTYSNLNTDDRMVARSRELKEIKNTIEKDYNVNQFFDSTDRLHQTIDFINDITLKHIERTFGKERAEFFKQHPDQIESYIGSREYNAIVDEFLAADNNTPVDEIMNKLKEQGFDFSSYLAQKEHKETRLLGYIKQNLNRMSYDDKKNKIARDYFKNKINFDIHETQTIKDLLNPLEELSRDSFNISEAFKTRHNKLFADENLREKYGKRYKDATEKGKMRQLEPEYNQFAQYQKRA
jgi:hypothetical protein